jgi:hypothetical protein
LGEERSQKQQKDTHTMKEANMWKVLVWFW